MLVDGALYFHMLAHEAKLSSRDVSNAATLFTYNDVVTI